MILSVPHGGAEDVESIPERLDGCPIEGTSPEQPKEERCDFEAGHEDPSCIDGELCGASTVTDANTIDLAMTVADRMEEVLGGRPHMVICNLLR